MRLPTPLLRNNPRAHKNNFGHVLILAGSPQMLGAASLAALSAMRSGAGLVTLAVPKSLQLAAQKKISPVIMTLPLPETSAHTLSPTAFREIQKRVDTFQAIALGPGLSRNKNTQKLILKIIAKIEAPMVIDADALNALASNPKVLLQNKGIKILTPHPGEMSRLTRTTRSYIQENRLEISRKFAKQYQCILLLKGHQTIVAAANKLVYTNKTGNVGMATAGSGDVLTGILAAFLGQGLAGFEAAKYAAYFHGKAGDLAAREKGKVSMIAADIIEKIPQAMKSR